MTMQDWVMQTFPGDGYMDGNVMVAQTDDAIITANPSWLASQLGDTVPPTYAYLQTTPLYTQMGWGWIIDQWKEKGIIS